MTNSLKKVTFSLWGILILMMANATITEKLYGSATAETYIYSSPFFIVLWIVTTVFSLAYMCKRHLGKRKATYALHLAFILILSGALTTHFLAYKEVSTCDKEPNLSVSSVQTMENQSPFLLVYH